MSLELVGNILLDSVAYAMILFMITVGLSMTMGLLRVVNLAHGAFAMGGGFLAATLPSWLGLSAWSAIGVAIVTVTLAAVPVERWLLRRFYGRSDLDQMLVTIGFMFICVALANMIFGSGIVSVPLPSELKGSIEIGPRMLQKHRIFVTVLGLLVLVVLWFAVERSNFGIKVRAAVDNARIAEAVGIDTTRVYAIAFAVGAALAAIGGIAGAELLPMEASYASKYLVTFLAVIAVGGQGTLFGSFVAALLLGGVETTTKYLMPQLASVAFFLTMFLVLLLRPQGLFGRRA